MKRTKIAWECIFAGPYLSPQENTAAPAAVTTPDCTFQNGEMIFYIGGVDAGKERIMRASIDHIQLDQPNPELIASANVVLEAGPFEYDCYHVYDPAAVVHQGNTYLFYSANGTGPDSIGLAISKDGKIFSKLPQPVLTGRSPEVVLHDGKWFLFYVLPSSRPAYEIYLATSEDGAAFQPLGKEPVLSWGTSGEWDEFEVTTPRIFSRNGVSYMVYGGCRSANRKDMPDAFGLARSVDLIHWEKYPDNPVFLLGTEGQWDDGAIWFGTVFEWENQLYLIYEGGRLPDIVEHLPALTQVGLARISCEDFDQLVSQW